MSRWKVVCEIDADKHYSTVTQLCYSMWQGEDGPDIRGGCIDALVVHATAAGKSGTCFLKTNFLSVYNNSWVTVKQTFDINTLMKVNISV